VVIRMPRPTCSSLRSATICRKRFRNLLPGGDLRGWSPFFNRSDHCGLSLRYPNIVYWANVWGHFSKEVQELERLCEQGSLGSGSRGRQGAQRLGYRMPKEFAAAQAASFAIELGEGQGTQMPSLAPRSPNPA
jgi:hypothetical protein